MNCEGVVKVHPHSIFFHDKDQPDNSKPVYLDLHIPEKNHKPYLSVLAPYRLFYIIS